MDVEERISERLFRRFAAVDASILVTGIISRQCAPNALQGVRQRFAARRLSNKCVYSDVPGCGRDIVDAEEDDSRRWRDQSYSLCDFKAVYRRQGNVQKYDVWDLFHNLSKCLLAVCGFPTHLPFGVPSEQKSHSHPHDRVVIND